MRDLDSQFEYKLVDRLIHESTLAARTYMFLAAGFLCLAAGLLLLSLSRFSQESMEKMISGVTTLFGLIPIPLFLNARSQRVGLLSLKERWVFAKANNDQFVMAKLKIRFEQLEDKVIEKGLGPIK